MLNGPVKIVSKVLANRLERILIDLVMVPNYQIIFITERIILNRVAIAQVIVVIVAIAQEFVEIAHDGFVTIKILILSP